MSEEAKEERREELEGIAEGLIARGVPPGLAHQTVALIYAMGRIDALVNAAEEKLRDE